MRDTVEYKFTLANGAAPFGRGIWHPARWRSVEGQLVGCQHGIHYCLERHLAGWISEELWLFEDGSPVEAFEHERSKMVTRRGRVTDRLAGWTADAMAHFSRCAANRALLQHAPRALRDAGLEPEARQLETLGPIGARSAAVEATRALDALTRAALPAEEDEADSLYEVQRAKHVLGETRLAVKLVWLARSAGSRRLRASAATAAHVAQAVVVAGGADKETEYLSGMITSLIGS
jgi:hypothetical protein